MKNKETRSSRLLELDALRGLACIFVVLFHFTMGKDNLKGVFKYGITGVDLFFIISGFVIFLTLKKTSKWQDFVISRFSRLYPGYWTCVSFTAFCILSTNYFYHISDPHFFIDYLANMTMFQHYFGVYDLDGPYWTMITEMVFYLFMLGIYLFFGLKNTERCCLVVLVCIVFYSTILPSFPKIHHFIRAAIPLVNHFPLFFAGILFYKIKFEEGNYYRWAGVLLCLLVQLSLLEDGKRVILYINQLEYGVMLGIYFGLFVLYCFDKLQIIVNPVSLYLGKISYSLYLIHQFVSIKIIIPFLTEYLAVNFAIAISITLIIVVGLASLVTYFVERPALVYLREHLSLRFSNVTRIK